jgi:hypothetical protein
MTRATGLSAFASRRFWVAWAICAVMGCGASLPLPRTGPHPQRKSDYIEVPYPPPPGHVEMIPSSPRQGAVWVDGQWNFEGGRWAWQPGGWVIPPAGAYFAPWTTVRLANGKLLFLPASWYGSDNRPLPPPAVLASAGQAG